MWFLEQLRDHMWCLRYEQRPNTGEASDVTPVLFDLYFYTFKAERVKLHCIFFDKLCFLHCMWNFLRSNTSLFLACRNMDKPFCFFVSWPHLAVLRGYWILNSRQLCARQASYPLCYSLFFGLLDGQFLSLDYYAINTPLCNDGADNPLVIKNKYWLQCYYIRKYKLCQIEIVWTVGYLCCMWLTCVLSWQHMVHPSITSNDPWA